MTSTGPTQPATAATSPLVPAARGGGDGPASGEATSDAIVDAVLAIPGVVAMHAGAFGEVATYLPGRRVVGVRSTQQLLEVHVVARNGSPLLALAEEIRDIVTPLAGTPVHVYINDLREPSPVDPTDPVPEAESAVARELSFPDPAAPVDTTTATPRPDGSVDLDTADGTEPAEPSQLLEPPVTPHPSRTSDRKKT